jgi:hypothetical protein
MKNIEKTNSVKLNIISDLLSEKEIQSALIEKSIKTTQLVNPEKTRGLEPVVLAAIITAGASIYASTTLIVLAILEKFKNKKDKGNVIINNIYIPFDATKEELKNKFGEIEKSGEIEQIIITNNDESK